MSDQTIITECEKENCLHFRCCYPCKSWKGISFWRVTCDKKGITSAGPINPIDPVIYQPCQEFEYCQLPFKKKTIPKPPLTSEQRFKSELPLPETKPEIINLDDYTRNENPLILHKKR